MKINQKEFFNKLPENLQKEIKKTLGCFNECFLVATQKDLKITTSVMLTSEPSFEVRLATFDNKTILTKKERIVAYMENFKDYSMEYKGKRNYQTMELDFSWLNEECI